MDNQHCYLKCQSKVLRRTKKYGSFFKTLIWFGIKIIELWLEIFGQNRLFHFDHPRKVPCLNYQNTFKYIFDKWFTQKLTGNILWEQFVKVRLKPLTSHDTFSDWLQIDVQTSQNEFVTIFQDEPNTGSSDTSWLGLKVKFYYENEAIDKWLCNWSGIKVSYNDSACDRVFLAETVCLENLKSFAWFSNCFSSLFQDPTRQCS